MSVFRNRGVRTVLDTIQQAEWDMDSIQVSEPARERIGRQLLEIPVSDKDHTQGDVRVRVLEGLEVIFFLAREGEALVVTIIRVRLPDPHDPIEALLKRLDKLAMLRSATGI